jgi:pyrimidine operon attenuation protein/uracil phosphoribosyltransferase
MIKENHIILDNTQINQKIKRIAYQIYEFSKKIAEVLEEISTIKVTLCEVVIDKKKPLQPLTTSIAVSEYKNKPLVLVDDVLNSGTTLIYGIKHFLEVPLKRFKTAVLVNRNHKKYPVKADFKGISLSTSIKEHVQVEFNEKEAIAYLV